MYELTETEIKERTDKIKKEYIDANGYICPFCKSENITTESFDESYTQKVMCNDCKKSWCDIFKLIDIEFDVENIL